MIQKWSRNLMAYNCLNEKNALVMVSWKIFVLWKATGLIYFHAQMQPRKVSLNGMYHPPLELLGKYHYLLCS